MFQWNMKLGLIIFVGTFLLLAAFYGPAYLLFLIGVLCGVAFSENT